jgi:hypothetical protein
VSLRPLSESEVDRLLGELCVRLGFCLPPDDQERLRADPPSDADTFTDAVLLAERMDPVLADASLRRSVRARVIDAFNREPFGSAERCQKTLWPMAIAPPRTAPDSAACVSQGPSRCWSVFPPT